MLICYGRKYNKKYRHDEITAIFLLHVACRIVTHPVSDADR